MKRSIILVLMLFPVLAFSQMPERKIIIEDSTFWFITINEENQLATLHTGNVDAPLNERDKHKVPGGRNLTEDFNPLAWDVMQGYLFWINFLDHPLNDRMEAIKRISVEELAQYQKYKPRKLLMASADQYMLTYNRPYEETLLRSRHLKGFFFDMSILQNNISITITSNDTIRTWRYDGQQWKGGPVRPMPTTEYFSTVTFQDHLFMFQADGTALDMRRSTPTPFGKKLNTNVLKDGVLVINRDTEEVRFLTADPASSKMSLRELLSKSSFEIFKKSN